MVNARMKNVFVVTAVAIAAVFMHSGLAGHNILKKKIDTQIENVEGLRRYSATYKAAEDGRKKFERIYKKLPALRHNLALLEIADFNAYGVETDTDNLVVKVAEGVVAGDVYIGLVRACLTTGVGGGDTLYLRAPNYVSLQSGIERLAARPDVELGSITLIGKGPFPIAKLKNFCILMREI